MADANGTVADGKAKTLGEVRKRELDILNALLLLFTYGQLALILWDMLMQLHGVPELVTGLTGISDPASIHSRREMTTAYLSLLGIYITRNAVNRYKGKEDSEELPEYVFLGLTRGYFYLALWGTVCFVAYMAQGLTLISRLPYELVITMSGVIAGLGGNKTVSHFLGKREVAQLQEAGDISDKRDIIMAYVDKNLRITNKQCREITGFKKSQAAFVLAELEKEGQLEQVGRGRYAYYRRKGTNN